MIPPPKPKVVLGLLGTTLDKGQSAKRWQRWRPTVDLGRQPNLPLDRLELLYGPGSDRLAAFVAEDVRSVSPSTHVRLHAVHIEDWWDFEEVYGALWDFVDGYPFDMDAEAYLVHMTTGSHVAQICWFLLVEAGLVPAHLLQLSPPPASDRSKPGRHTVIDLDLSRYDAIARRFTRRAREGASFLKSGIDTKNPAFNALIDEIERVAIASRAPILLLGPTGAGKSQLARKIYELKKRRRLLEGPFVEVNCATLRGDQAMSALFGHRRGAFTGAEADRPGLLRAAHRGLLFLDEIGELGHDEQAMLLRAIEDKRFLPVGSDQEVESDFGLIAGTNQNLADRAREGRFRDDLLARIDLWTFELPGLADRPEDVEPNLAYELERIEASTGDRVSFNKEARARFLEFAAKAPWPRNFRDFGASLTRMATLAPGGRIDLPTVERELERLERAWRSPAPAPSATVDARSEIPPEVGEVDLFERVQLAEVIRVCGRSDSLSDAGRRLFAVSRARKKNPNDADRLRKYLARFGLDFARARAFARSE
jgi:transcriptional regulatory protein RtcR